MPSSFTPIPLVKVAMPSRERLMPALEKVLYSGMVAEGESVYSFEAKFAQAFELANVVATSSGTGALHIALLLAGVVAGDEVISTSMTAEPTNTTILQVGAVPVFADVDPSNGNVDPDSVETRLSSRTRAIVVVHYAGYPADMVRIREIADRRGIAVIEDCAHALGARFADRPIGTIADFSIFSLQSIKHMTTVDGGILAMRDASRMGEARRLRWFGLTKGVPRTEVDIARPGFKYNMNNVTATIGLAQLEGVHQLVDAHIDNGRFFDQALRNIPGIEPARVIARSQPSYWIYTLLADDSAAVERCLAGVGVAASKLHRPNHLHSVFAPYAEGHLMPGLETFYRRLVHIPCGWWLEEEGRERIVDSLRRG